MTKSEQITSLISKKFFLEQYIYTDIYVKENSLESEFCDCLIEFNNAYVVIQIKEKNPTGKSSSNEWFEKKVLKNAKKQIKDTFKYFSDDKNTIFSKSSDLIVDRSKTIFPVIVFLNTDMHEYERITFSQSIDCNINIFSYEDFKTMLETIILPYDILSYLSYRIAFKADDKDKWIADDVDDTATILATPSNEIDYAEMFLVRTYYKALIQGNVKEENVKFYNHIISELNKAVDFRRCSLIEDLLCIDYIGADKVSRNWLNLLELAKENKFVKPFKITKGDDTYLFFSHPNNMLENEYLIMLELAAIYSRHIDKATYAHIIAIRHIENEQYLVELSEFNLETDVRYDELVEIAKNMYE